MKRQSGHNNIRFHKRVPWDWESKAIKGILMQAKKPMYKYCAILSLTFHEIYEGFTTSYKIGS